MKAVFALALAAAVGAGLWWSQRDDGAPVADEARASPQPALAGAAVGSVLAQVPASAAGVSPPLPTPITAAVLAAQPPGQAVRGLLQCHATNSCRAASREGLDEHFEIVGALMQQIERLQAQGNPAEQSALVRELLAFPDGHVQAAL